MVLLIQCLPLRFCIETVRKDLLHKSSAAQVAWISSLLDCRFCLLWSLRRISHEDIVVGFQTQTRGKSKVSILSAFMLSASGFLHGCHRLRHVWFGVICHG